MLEPREAKVTVAALALALEDSKPVAAASQTIAEAEKRQEAQSETCGPQAAIAALRDELKNKGKGAAGKKPGGKQETGHAVERQEQGYGKACGCREEDVA